MNNLQGNGSNIKVWLQELKSNKKTQVALAVFVLVVSYLCYELFVSKTSSPRNTRPTNTRIIVGQPLEPTQIASLENLPNLIGLHKAGELPSENRMFRDIFLFDSPPPPPPPPPTPKAPEPEKPPPTEAELAAAERMAAMNRELRAQPSSYKLVAILEGRTSPRKGAFLLGDDIDFFKLGDEATPNWRLVALSEEEASFQNTKFQELRFSLKVQLGTQDRGSGQSQHVTNQF